MPALQPMTAVHEAESAAGPGFSLLLLFSRRWILPTLLVLLGMAGLVRLGFWQLDRLEQKRHYNAAVRAQLAAPPVDVHALGDEWSADLAGRRAVVTGTFDYANQVGIKNRFYKDAPGVNLLTPFHITDSDLVLMVDRGWIPLDTLPRDWPLFNEEEGEIQIMGLLRPSGSMSLEARGGRAVEIPADRMWYREDLEALTTVLELPLAPLFLERALDPDAGYGFPRRQAHETELNEGNHLSYALQWYTFALILGIGYVILVRRRTLQPLQSVGPEDGVGTDRH